MRNPRLFDMIVIWTCLALVALSQRSASPSATTAPSAPTLLGTRAVLWRDARLALNLRRLPGIDSARRARLQLSLSNQTANFCWIPGTFCQEGQEADWWSHAVRVHVDGPNGPWRVGPRYGERDLHQHESFLSFIRPEQQMDWEFCLGDLIEGTDGGPISDSWERAEGPFLVTCELSQPGHKVISNQVKIGS